MCKFRRKVVYSPHSALINSKNSNSAAWNIPEQSHVFINDVAWNILGMEYSRPGSAVQTGTFHSKYVEN